MTSKQKTKSMKKKSVIAGDDDDKFIVTNSRSSVIFGLCDANNESSMNLSSTETKLYKRRWWILFVFSWTSFANSVVYASYASISTQSVVYYNVDFNWINSLSSMFYLAYIPFSFISGWFIDKYGISKAVILGSIFQTLGAWIKYFSSFSYDPVGDFAGVFVGQLISAISQTFIVGCTGLLPVYWFGPKERVTATSIGFMMNTFGTGAALLIAPYVVASDGTGMPVWLLSNAVFVTVVTIMALIWMKNKPPIPPSPYAVSQDETSVTHITFKKALKMLFTNRNYVLIWLSEGFMLGIFWAFQALIQQIGYNSGYGDSAGIYGFIVKK